MSEEREAEDAYGEGEAGYKSPRGVADKLKRKNLPYKVSFVFLVWPGMGVEDC